MKTDDFLLALTTLDVVAVVESTTCTSLRRFSVVSVSGFVFSRLVLLAGCLRLLGTATTTPTSRLAKRERTNRKEIRSNICTYFICLIVIQSVTLGAEEPGALGAAPAFLPDPLGRPRPRFTSPEPSPLGWTGAGRFSAFLVSLITKDK